MIIALIAISAGLLGVIIDQILYSIQEKEINK
jgi:hypothetical protein